MAQGYAANEALGLYTKYFNIYVPALVKAYVGFRKRVTGLRGIVGRGPSTCDLQPI